MNLSQCSENCVHQIDGYCSLANDHKLKNVLSDKCPFYLFKDNSNNENLLTNQNY